MEWSIRVMGIPKEEGGKEAEHLFKAIIAENYPKLGKKLSI